MAQVASLFLRGLISSTPKPNVTTTSVAAIVTEAAQSPCFALTSLPMELQLRILHYSLVSPLPILDAGFSDLERFYLTEGDERGQDRINPHILFTCKLYYVEGLVMLYTRNTFLYNPHDLGYVDPIPAHTSLTGIERLSMIENLCVRRVYYRDEEPIHRVVDVMDWLAKFTNVQNFQVDFAIRSFKDVNSLSYPLDSPLLTRLISDMTSEAERICNIRKQAMGGDGLLDTLLLTGLEANDPFLRFFVVRTMSRLLRLGGRFGIISHRFHGKAADKYRHRQPQFIWIAVKDLSAWIEKEREMFSIKFECQQQMFASI
ncbi:hypothetical protein MMC12_003576 [Toensbergia leucococca]|nr:hypothetical protein [Toensbergia leucococca]